ncbi:MAG TPA: peptidylprolyl isomerase [Bacteroidales bacterium]|nr:peptidylprolyl isomerase [Bacteroidales bacterium]
MAVIGQIRKRSGILIIIVGIALASFVLGDFLSPRQGRRSNNIGMVNGEALTYMDFSTRSEEQMELVRQNQNKDKLSPDEMFQIRQQTWNEMLSEVILGEEYKKLGLSVTPEELFDQVQGPEPHAYILQYFRDPQTNMYNPELVRNYLRNLDQMEPEAKNQWLLLEKAIKQDRITAKYRNLLGKAYYMPSAFAKMDYELRNTGLSARVIGLRYDIIPNDQVSLTDADYQAYYEENKFRYEQEESRDIDYVVFNVAPSPEDIAQAEKDIAEINAEFGAASDVADYVNANSDERYDSTYKTRGSLSPTLDSVMFSAPVGAVVGPFFENQQYQIARLIDRQARPDSMKASHLLIAYQGAFNAQEGVSRTKDQAKALADSLSGILRPNVAMFEAAARQYSNDPSVKDNGGNLDWFADQSMVGPFNDAVLKGKVGDVTVAETPFGYHVIHITGKKEPVQKVRVAIVKRSLEASSNTFQDIYTKASQFAGENNTAEAFEAAVTAQGLNKLSATDIKKMDSRIPGLTSPRAVIQWAFMEETEKGSVSTVFDVEGSFVVALLKEVREEGIAPLEQIKTRIEPLVIREKKAKMLIDRFTSAKGDLNQMAATLGAKVDTLTNVSFASANLPAFGPEPEVVGGMFSASAGAVSSPVQGNMAVYVYQVDAVTPPPAKEDLSQESLMLRRVFENKVAQLYFEVIQDLSDIEDNRYMYF